MMKKYKLSVLLLVLTLTIFMGLSFSVDMEVTASDWKQIKSGLDRISK